MHAHQKSDSIGVVNEKRKLAICSLLKGIETGDPASVAVVNPNKYIQHNPETQEGGEGLAELFKRLARSNPKVNIVRVFADGDFVFAHTEYDFSTHRVGFEVFRFEGEQTVEHWDNIQSRQGPNPGGHSMVDGSTELTDLDTTESNRALIRSFVDKVLIGDEPQELSDTIDESMFIDHNPRFGEGLAAIQNALASRRQDGSRMIQYDRLHHLLAEGNFVLSACEGWLDGKHVSFYDLFRLDDGRIVEHWDTLDEIPHRSLWKNENGKF